MRKASDTQSGQELETLWGLSTEYLEEDHRTEVGGRSSNIQVLVEAGDPEGVVAGHPVGNMTEEVRKVPCSLTMQKSLLALSARHPALSSHSCTQIRKVWVFHIPGGCWCL